MEIEEDEKKEVMEEEEEEEEDVEPDSVLFVKNLNFDTTEEALNKVCMDFNLFVCLLHILT